MPATRRRRVQSWAAIKARKLSSEKIAAIRNAARAELNAATSQSALTRACGVVIALQRKLRKMQQQELADALGVSQSIVSRVEAGKYTLTVERLEAFAQALGTHASDIMERAEQLI